MKTYSNWLIGIVLNFDLITSLISFSEELQIVLPLQPNRLLPPISEVLPFYLPDYSLLILQCSLDLTATYLKTPFYHYCTPPAFATYLITPSNPWSTPDSDTPVLKRLSPTTMESFLKFKLDFLCFFVYQTISKQWPISLNKLTILQATG